MLLSLTQKITSVGALMDKMNLCALLVRLQNVAATVDNSLEIPQRIKNKIIVHKIHFWVYT